MNKLLTVLLVLLCWSVFPGLVLAGNIDSPGPPAAGSGMVTLEELYNYLTSGQAPSVPGNFQEPVSGPGSTGKTIQEVYDNIKIQFDDCAATPADVCDGVKFFSTAPGGWGPQIGTCSGCVTCSGTLYRDRWCDNGDGTVTDMTTGLVWLKDANYLSGTRPWEGASINADQVDGGVSDSGDIDTAGNWRLPTIKELYNVTQGDNPILTSGDTTPFDNVQASTYWSSTSWRSLTFNAWHVDFSDGSVNTSDKSILHYVWPVKGGQ